MNFEILKFKEKTLICFKNQTNRTVLLLFCEMFLQ